jgi:hypothetical protein
MKRLVYFFNIDVYYIFLLIINYEVENNEPLWDEIGVGSDKRAKEVDLFGYWFFVHWIGSYLSKSSEIICKTIMLMS